ncbi:MAG: tetratricopeptide repeat protein [Alphaproteobacteria bacterium]
MALDYVKIRREAGEGNLSACHLIGIALRRGDNAAGVEKDPELAVAYFTRGMQGGSLKCQYELAQACLNGDGIAKDEKRGLQLVQDAAEKGHFSSMENLGIHYLQGRLLLKDDQKAFDIFRRYTENALRNFEDLGSLVMIADGVIYYPLCLAYGIGCPKDAPRAHAVLQELALKGFHAAQRCLQQNAATSGMMVLNLRPELAKHGVFALDLSEVTGRPAVVKTLKKAEEDWQATQIAAKEGNAAGCLQMGLLHAAGNQQRGIEKDATKAAAFYERGMSAAIDPTDNEASNLECQYLLYHACMGGRGVARDQVRALELLKNAADRGHMNSIVEMGKLHVEGRLVPQDQKGAFRIFETYAEDVMRNRKVPKRFDQALESNDFLYYPVCIVLGIGCDKNASKGYDVLRRMAVMGFDDAKKCLEKNGLLDPVMISFLDPAAFSMGAMWIDLQATQGSPFKEGPPAKSSGKLG